MRVVLPLLALVSSTAAFAAPAARPLTITHTGHLLDDRDAPLEEPALAMTFRLFDRSAAVSGETRIWEASCTIAVKHGYYAATLGEGPCAGTDLLDTDDLPATAARWLEVSIDGAALSPRLAIAAVPVAATARIALDSQRFGGLEPSAFWTKAEDVSDAKLGSATVGTHTHAAATLTGFDAAAVAAVKSAGLPWSSVTGVDATTPWPGTIDASRLAGASAAFAASSHTHSALDVTSGKLDNARLHTGHGEGLDADTVDGRHAADLALAGHTHTAAQVTDLQAAVLTALANTTIDGTLGATGGIRVGQATTCDANTRGTLRFEPTAKVMEYCGDFGWTRFGQNNAGLTEAAAGQSCKALRAAGVADDGAYWIDPDGSGSNPAFRVWCDMNTDGGGWTLVTALVVGATTTAVTNTTLVSPSTTTNVTNRNMRLPGVTEVLVVQDGRDSGAETAWDKAEKYTGVTGLSLTWQQILDALNQNTGSTWSDLNYSTGSDDPWRFTVSRVNTGGCQQTPLRGDYGDGNYGAFNTDTGQAGIGMLYHHWGQETWASGTWGGYTDLRCNSQLRNFTNYFKGLYLR